MSLRPFASAAAVLAVTASLMLVAGPASAQTLPANDDLYAIACNSGIPNLQLLALDPLTGTGTSVGAGTGPGDSDCAGQAAWNPVTGASYYVLWDGEDRLASIDVTTGVSTTIGPFNGPDWTGGDSIAIGRDGTAYLISDSELFSLDLATAEVGLIGSTGFPNIWGFAYDPVTDAFYGLDDDGNLYTIDTVTGAATLVTTFALGTTTNSYSLQFDSAGVLWIENDYPGVIDLSAELWSVNPTTFAAELAGPIQLADASVYVYTESLLITRGAVSAVVPPAQPKLPDTGVEMGPIGVAGFMLLTAGIAMMLVRRRAARA